MSDFNSWVCQVAVKQCNLNKSSAEYLPRCKKLRFLFSQLYFLGYLIFLFQIVILIWKRILIVIFIYLDSTICVFINLFHADFVKKSQKCD